MSIDSSRTRLALIPACRLLGSYYNSYKLIGFIFKSVQHIRMANLKCLQHLKPKQ